MHPVDDTQQPSAPGDGEQQPSGAGAPLTGAQDGANLTDENTEPTDPEAPTEADGPAARGEGAEPAPAPPTEGPRQETGEGLGTSIPAP